jgi:hypothetical protein
MRKRKVDSIARSHFSTEFEHLLFNKRKSNTHGFQPVMMFKFRHQRVINPTNISLDKDQMACNSFVRYDILLHNMQYMRINSRGRSLVKCEAGKLVKHRDTRCAKSLYRGVRRGSQYWR